MTITIRVVKYRYALGGDRSSSDAGAMWNAGNLFVEGGVDVVGIGE